MKKFSYSIFVVIWLLSSNIVLAEKFKGETNNNTGLKSTFAAGCIPATGSTELDLNNVRALIHTGGDMWWDLQGTAKYEIPKGSGKTALFAGSIWIGGQDVNGQLKLAAQRFRNGGVDYWPGPLITTGSDRGTTTSDVCLQYDKHFNIKRNDVAEFRAWFNADQDTRAELFPGYAIPDIILNWPAHGDEASGYDYYLAPFMDVDGDGYYDPYAGDYPFYDLDGELPCGTSREQRIPRLFGDQTLWWVYNDRGNIHTETQGDAIGMEIRGQAFAFSTNDKMNDMTFYNYTLINRSTYTLVETYFGVWTDADMGNPEDDYVGCDVNRGLGFLYNGDAVDDPFNGQAYGGPNPPPPAIGVDFFEGPYQDPDQMDNPSSWDPITGDLICDGNILNGNINGLNFGDGIVDNERWGMRRFIYFNNSSNNDMNDPQIAPDYYNYLLGLWKNGARMLYGGNGFNLNVTDTETDFMFPGDTDPCGWGQGGVVMPTWSEKEESTDAGDRRFVHSAGPFTLEPGAINDITTGIVWARATGGDEYESVEEVRIADDKAQLLFENCFKVVNGPDAPDLKYIELDKQVVFHISNSTSSNNFLESYEEKDFAIVNIDVDGDGQVDNVDKFYRFEGYQVFQFKNASVSVGDIGNINLVREVFQCDLKNDVDQLVNYTWSEDMNANIPSEMVNGNDEGIEHSFIITEDAFALEDKRLVNHKRYFFAILAYGYNSYMYYDQNSASAIDGQKLPYKAGRKGATGPIEVYEVIPHVSDPGEGGTIINAEYGEGLEIIQHEGFGSGPNIVDLTQETIDKIMSGEPWRAEDRKYKTGYAPIQIKVVDPLNVPEGDFEILFDPDSAVYNDAMTWDWRIKDGKWYIIQTGGESIIDTIYSNSGIKVRNEQIISELGLSISVQSQDYLDNPDENGVVEGSLSYLMEWTDINKAWLRFVNDGEDANSINWIRAGTHVDPNEPDYDDYKVSSDLYDDDENFEKILGGTWAPYKLVSEITDGPANPLVRSQIKFYKNRISSVDIVFTADKSKWTRSCVIEMSENDTLSNGDDSPALFGEGDAFKHDIRDSYSVDKDGNYATTDAPSTNPDDANYISGKGMGWFPGYAIDVETGDRLNIVFGEASEFPGENGRDMKWNPSSNYFSNFGQVLFGGKHYIYIVSHNFWLNQGNHVDTSKFMPRYDGGKLLHERISSTSTLTKKKAFEHFTWTAIPITSPAYSGKSIEDMLIGSDLKISIRISNPHRAGHYSFAVDNPLNDNFQRFSFNTRDIMTIKNDEETAKDALDLINIVPNPYYGYSQYELSQLENLVKITNLPPKCTVSIYNVAGTLIRRFKKDSDLSYQDWDLKNQYGIPIASGVYIIHIDADELGEKILKWFGALRPIDLNSF